MLSGVFGVAERTYVNGALVHARSPIAGTESVDNFYQGSAGAGHAIDNFAFDLGFMGSFSPLTAVTSKGGYVGVTYIHVPGTTDPATQSDSALELLAHHQIFPTAANQPLFWVRSAFNGNTMTSDLVSHAGAKAKGTSFTVDATYPVDPVLQLGAGLGFYGYDNASQAFFDEAQRNMTSLSRYLLGATVLGLPRTSANVNGTYQISDWDLFTPRYTATEIDSTRQWTHTLNLGWKHNFSKTIAMTPAYEVSISGNRAFSGLMLDLFYSF